MLRTKSLKELESNVLGYIANKPDVFFKKCTDDGTFELSSIEKWENEKKSMEGKPVYKYTEEDFEMNQIYNDMPETEKAYVNKLILEYYKVDYIDTTNFIYIYNRKSTYNYLSNGEWDYIGLVQLYMKEFITKFIRCQNISSFPVYPNMEFCELNNQQNSEYKITSFPVQPSMVDCSINYHNLKTFPVQPKMEICSLVSNKLESFPVQPAMISCNISKNYLESFPSQPNAISISVNDNNLKTLSIQPNMKHCFINNNCLESFPIQPNMTLIYIDSPGHLTLSKQPKLKSIKAL
jgi:hypothetical protein